MFWILNVFLVLVIIHYNPRIILDLISLILQFHILIYSQMDKDFELQKSLFEIFLTTENSFSVKIIEKFNLKEFFFTILQKKIENVCY